MSVDPVFLGRNSIFLLEHVIKIGLAGEAEVGADFAEGLVGIAQKAFRFLQLASHDKAADIKAKLRLKTA